MKDIIQKLVEGRCLTDSDVDHVVGQMLDGSSSEAELAGFLVGLQAKGVTGRELLAFVRALLPRALPFPSLGMPCVDTCGTGGDGMQTFNVSSASALVLATLGLPVTKHGNRGVSSSCGSSDIFSAMGVPLRSDACSATQALQDHGFTYLHAPSFHPALASIAPVRKALGIRTVFNLLGPLLNPARPRFQVVGVFGPDWLDPVAEALAPSVESALVVHGGGTDEIVPWAETQVRHVDRGKVHRFSLEPRCLGASQSRPEDSLVRDRFEAVARFRALLEGRGSLADRETVALNAGAALWIAGKAETLQRGVETGLELLRSDAVARFTERLVAPKQELSHA